jgi:hypothetical protein
VLAGVWTVVPDELGVVDPGTSGCGVGTDSLSADASICTTSVTLEGASMVAAGSPAQPAAIRLTAEISKKIPRITRQ